MKFELTEPNKQYSNSELIDDLKQVAQMLDKKSLTQREYDENGRFSYQTQKNRFGSWLNAVNEAGLNQSKRPWGGDLSETRIPKDQLIKDLNKVSEQLGKRSITMSDYDNHGEFGSATICKRFGGWNNAKKEAGLKIGRLYNSSDEDYFENILSVWQKLGRQPRYQEMTAPLSKLNISSYERKFGTWRKALEQFIGYVNSKKDIEEETISETDNEPTNNASPQPTIIESKKEVKPQKRTNRIANLRQRFKVMKRDGFKCVLCGTSPVLNPGCELHIDHIVPWSKGGETVIENLQTLCSNCNQGKSNL